MPDTPLRKLAEAPGDPYMLCPSKAATPAFIRDLIRDAYEAFDHTARIHLGGDECHTIGFCPRCHGHSPADLLAGYMRGSIRRHQPGHAVEFWRHVLASANTRQPPTDTALSTGYIPAQRARPHAGPLRGYPGQRPRYRRSEPPAQLLDGLPAALEPMRPFLVNADTTCNAFYGAHFEIQRLQGNGGQRCAFGGDSYALPRTRTTCERRRDRGGRRELGADQLVTSWAVRLSHPRPPGRGCCRRTRHWTRPL